MITMVIKSGLAVPFALSTMVLNLLGWDIETGDIP
jgi:hypothetical protein